ncbi:MAG: hypothetical protein IAF08_08475 [Rhizobacter sp.]|nr:hypothetical protein [Chlorobiales bacterium]
MPETLDELYLDFSKALFLFSWLLYYCGLILVCNKMAAFSSMSLKAVLAELSLPLLSLLVTNAIVFLVYLPNLYFNPEINWSLKDPADRGADPVLIFQIFPVVQLLLSYLIILGNVVAYRRQAFTSNG